MECELQEKNKLKNIMIAICSFLEEKYQKRVHELTMERDPNLHYDIELE